MKQYYNNLIYFVIAEFQNMFPSKILTNIQSRYTRINYNLYNTQYKSYITTETRTLLNQPFSIFYLEVLIIF